ncbi:hypothetical protein NIIDMKKI_31860 [Mycobacterium kansasii]|uniref:Uncharacterized protein n=1 Tax=Mycobacterium kansasii TaxID=1768 RepID=A0A7G1IAW2_MYCKA|nr:hypothetical protein NIIDMKKI_31860 [Mycobacterium kansasii]
MRVVTDREEFMAEKSGPQEGVEGVVEGAKGKAKEVLEPSPAVTT